MGRRRRKVSGWLVSAGLRFFGISSPAVLLMVLLGYFGVRMPTPDAPADSPDAIARRAKQIIETVSSAKDKIKGRISSLTSGAGPAPTRTPPDDEDLMNVTYRELFDEPSPARAIPAPAKTPTPSVVKEPTNPPPPANVPKVTDQRKKSAFEDLNPNPFR